jgi:hypothetical protein
MTGAVVRRWCAWAPTQDGGVLASAADWQGWARAPRALGAQGVPEVAFLPAGIRRRATRLTRLMLHAAFEATTAEERPLVRSVFASRHGAIHVAVEILAAIDRGEPASPLLFSHSVHNTQAGLFSIAAGNREASSSVAAEADSFAHGFLDALLHLERDPGRPVLLVMGDEPVPDPLLPLVDEPAAAYAVGLLLAREGEGAPLELRLEASRAPRKAREWPDALEFVRFLASGAPELVLESGRRCWRWERKR